MVSPDSAVSVLALTSTALMCVLVLYVMPALMRELQIPGLEKQYLPHGPDMKNIWGAPFSSYHSGTCFSPPPPTVVWNPGSRAGSANVTGAQQAAIEGKGRTKLEQTHCQGRGRPCSAPAAHTPHTARSMRRSLNTC